MEKILKSIVLMICSITGFHFSIKIRDAMVCLPAGDTLFLMIMSSLMLMLGLLALILAIDVFRK